MTGSLVDALIAASLIIGWLFVYKVGETPTARNWVTRGCTVGQATTHVR